jgi:hypothetical protein
MPGSENDSDDTSIEGETRRRVNTKLKRVKEWVESFDENKRHPPLDEIKARPNQDNETLYVHLVAHTHDDVGWIKTVDQYYSGTN